MLSTFRRRLAILLVIGITHLSIWYGDIVAFYALVGFVLVSFRRFANRTLLALAYVAGLTLLYAGGGRRMLQIFAPVGKMALTNYILQSVIGIILFTGLGFALPPVGPAGWSLLAIVVFVVQIVFSTVWLSMFNFGPLEWVWRSATYGKLQPMRKLG